MMKLTRWKVRMVAVGVAAMAVFVGLVCFLATGMETGLEGWAGRSLIPSRSESALADKVSMAPVEGNLGERLRGSEAVPREPAGSFSHVKLLVRSKSGSVHRAVVQRIDADVVYVAGDEAADLSHGWPCDESGVVYIPASQTSSYLVACSGYIPVRLDDIAPASEHEVLLPQAIATPLSVSNQRGDPVQGFGVAIGQGSVSEHAIARIHASKKAWRFALGVHWWMAGAITDIKGGCVLMVPEGEHRPYWNTTDLPLILQLGRNLGISAGVPRRVTAAEPLACVVQLQGDTFSLVSAAPMGLGFAGDAQASRVRHLALARLEKLFPGCVLECGVDRGYRDPHVIVYACGESSGLSKHVAQCLPLSSWKAPVVFSVAAMPQLDRGRVEVLWENPDGRRFSPDHGEVLVQMSYDGQVVGFPLPKGGKFCAPLGGLNLAPSLSLPRDCGDAAAVMIASGDNVAVMRLKRPLFRGHLHFVSKSGERPARMSVDYGSGGVSRTRLLVNSGSIYGLFEKVTTYRAGGEGWAVAGECVVDEAVDPGTMQEWRVIVP